METDAALLPEARFCAETLDDALVVKAARDMQYGLGLSGHRFGVAGDLAINGLAIGYSGPLVLRGHFVDRDREPEISSGSDVSQNER